MLRCAPVGTELINIPATSNIVILLCIALSRPSEVNAWLLEAGWLLIDAGTTYAAVKVEVIENWPRVASKYLSKELELVAMGKYQFEELERLFEEHQPGKSSKPERGRSNTPKKHESVMSADKTRAQDDDE